MAIDVIIRSTKPRHHVTDMQGRCRQSRMEVAYSRKSVVALEAAGGGDNLNPLGVKSQRYAGCCPQGNG